MPDDVTPAGDVRLILLQVLFRRVRRLVTQSPSRGEFRRQPPKLMTWADEETLASDVRAAVARAKEDDPQAWTALKEVNGLVQLILDAGESDLQKLAKRLKDLVLGWEAAEVDKASQSDVSSFALRPDAKWTATVSVKPDAAALKQITDEGHQREFLAGVAALLAELRATNKPLSLADELVVERAYQLVDRGCRPPLSFAPIRTDAGRPYQTYLSFADPGDGHLEVTVRSTDLLAGLIVHIEYIDRDGVDDKSLVEAYRLPAIRNAAKVMLHVRDVTPCTVFIGRPVFEGTEFEVGLLKAAHTIAGVCSAMFAHGVADCKVAMDNLSAAQAVKFMRAVAGNVVREPLRQRLSAAFNLNSPVIDDRGAGKAFKIEGQSDIAKLAVELARLGRFDKVTLDGAGDRVPSRPIIGQLSRTQLFDVVHQAHRVGLETYISAGMRPKHMEDAVYIGVGGVGIGTALHSRDERTNAIGEIDPDLVRESLAVRDKAAKTKPGRAAAALARLDWTYARLPTPKLDQLCKKLFDSHRKFLEAYDAMIKKSEDSKYSVEPSAVKQLTARSWYGVELDQAEDLIHTLKSASDAKPVDTKPTEEPTIGYADFSGGSAFEPSTTPEMPRRLLYQLRALSKWSGKKANAATYIAKLDGLEKQGDWNTLATLLMS